MVWLHVVGNTNFVTFLMMMMTVLGLVWLNVVGTTLGLQPETLTHILL